MCRNRPINASRAPAAAAALTLLLAGLPDTTFGADGVDEIVVTSERQRQPRQTHIGNIERLDSNEISNAGHAHIHELLTRVAGVWVGRGSGQESLPSIRSPVLTGAGSCGVILTLEDGIPSRPAGFCNVNQLFELNTEQARFVEVIRGPGNALFGSNALHGTINVLNPKPDDGMPQYLELDAGANRFGRVKGLLRLPAALSLIAGIGVTDDGGFRDASGYTQIKGLLSSAGSAFGGSLNAALSVSDLKQQTAGFIFGEDAYKDRVRSRQNLNPEAFRDADSQRLYVLWRRTLDRLIVDVRPYARRSDMTFLQHFLPGKPLEENGHHSFGALVSATVKTEGATTVFGIDTEWADVFLKETQFGPTEGSDFLIETRPAGKHYDYDVRSLSAAPYLHTRRQISPTLSITAGLRAEFVRYDYSNNMLAGNSRDDGSVCGFGGCLYSRPASRSDSYINLAPKLGIALDVSENMTASVNLARGFRAPQMTELYRLQSGQAVSDLDSEVVDSLEVGVQVRNESWRLDASAFAMRKQNSVIRDSQGFNVSDAKSRHEGVEVSAGWQLSDDWGLAVNGSYARHTYDFDVIASRGETFVSGRDIDTAPRWIGSAEVGFEPNSKANASLQWVALGRYFLDAENRFSYPGHQLFNLRGSYSITPKIAVTLRVNNLLDTAIADRADFAFGNYRYFPGRGRELFLRVRYVFEQ